MNESILTELKSHLIETVQNMADDCTDFSELHHEAFNADYYIIGYYQANEWLKNHDIDAFEAISYVIEKENEHFGEINLKPSDINSERIVNLLVYFAGYEVMPIKDLSNIKKSKLIKLLKEA